MMQRQYRLWLLVLLILCLCGCTVSPPAANGYTVQDSKGNEVWLQAPPQRIVSLGVSNDEMVLALVEPARIAAISDMPSNEAAATQVKQRAHTNVESIVAQHPDLFVAADWMDPAFIAQVRAANIPIYVTGTPNVLADVKREITLLGKALDAEEKAQRIVSDLERRETALALFIQEAQKRGRIPPRAVYYSNMGVGGGIGSTFDVLTESAGFKNAVREVGLKNGELLSKEQLVALAPDLIVIAGDQYDDGTYTALRAEEIYADPALQQVPAVQNRRICVVDARHLLSLNQYMLNAAEAMAHNWYETEIEAKEGEGA